MKIFYLDSRTLKMGGANWNAEKMFKWEVGKQIRGNYALVPLVATIAFGSAICAFHVFRTAAKSPDVIVNRRSNPQPYNNYERDGQYIRYKYFTPEDYSRYTPDPDRPKLD